MRFSLLCPRVFPWSLSAEFSLSESLVLPLVAELEFPWLDVGLDSLLLSDWFPRSCLALAGLPLFFGVGCWLLVSCNSFSDLFGEIFFMLAF